MLRPALPALIVLPPAIYIYPLYTVEEVRIMLSGQCRAKSAHDQFIWQEQSKETDVKTLRYGVATLELFSTANSRAAGPLSVKRYKKLKFGGGLLREINVKTLRVWSADNGLFRTARQRKYQYNFFSGRTISEHN